MDHAHIIESFRHFVDDSVEAIMEKEGKVFAYHQMEFIYVLAGRLLEKMDSLEEKSAVERMRLMKVLSNISNPALERLRQHMECS